MGVFPRGSGVAIDLGTANTCIFADGQVALNEPSIIALNTARGGVEAVGSEASRMLGRTPVNITSVRPIRHGVIADFVSVETLLEHFVRKVSGRGYPRPRIVIGVQPASTQVERRAVKDSANRIKAREVLLVDESMAAAIGAGLPVTKATGNMIIDVGAGTTDIAVLSLAGVVYGRSLRVAGEEMDEAIIQHMKREHNLLIGERTAERIKMDIGSAAPLETPLGMDVKGRHLLEGVPRTVRVSDGEIREALREPVRAISKAVHEALERVPPELSADIHERGMVLTGGGALIRKLDTHLQQETGLKVVVAENPLETVVRGAGRLLTDGDLLTRLAVA